MAPLGDALEWLLHVPAWVALTVVFLFPALEASAFVGVLVPGEAAIVIGGALASQGRISLAAALAAAILGAIVGDTVGYAVGKRWGERMLPRLSQRRAQNLERAKAFIRRHPGWTVALGRFPPGIRTFVPGAAGMSHVRYRAFLVSNVVGAVVWGTTFVLLGYAAGRSWRRVEALVTRGGLLLLAAIVLVAWVVYSYRRGALSELFRRRTKPG
jgi:undecaprenyl-diphosphatase